MSQSVTKLGVGGRIVIPAVHRKALGLQPGDDVIMTLQDGDLRITSLQGAIKRVQAMVQRYVPEGTRLSDELLTDRRKAAADE